MIYKAFVALGVWIIVTLLLGLFGSLLITVSSDITVKIGTFLKDNDIILGFVAGLLYFFFGAMLPKPRV